VVHSEDTVVGQEAGRSENIAVDQEAGRSGEEPQRLADRTELIPVQAVGN
jgi:hypothetical protein